MDTLLTRHLPITTNRLEFCPQNVAPPPVITPRIDFAKRLAKNLNFTIEDSILTDDGGAMDGINAPLETLLADGGAMDINEPFVTPATPPNYVASDSGTEETADLLDTVNKKIPKPRGQVGHPGSGGYSLDFVLRKWGSTVITSVNVSD